MSSGPAVGAVGVVVPARNEQERVVACLRSIRRSLAGLPSTTTTAVTVVLDRCTDRTADLVAAELVGWPGAVAVPVAAPGDRHGGPGPSAELPHIAAGTGVGAVRDLGVRLTLARLGVFPPAGVWLLHTDADTVVPPGWASAHLREALAGACGVAGAADLRSRRTLSAAARRRYREVVAAGVDGHRHRHVYGANLGVRADAYLAVGGFPVDGVGEDHGLWDRLVAAGYPLVSPRAVAVRTSARLHGRAVGGLADLLHSLHTDPDADLGPQPDLLGRSRSGQPAGGQPAGGLSAGGRGTGDGGLSTWAPAADTPDGA